MLEIKDEPEIFKVFFEKVLEKKVVIDKEREIYQHNGTRIHLDKVKNLGTLVEFERKTKDSPETKPSPLIPKHKRNQWETIRIKCRKII